MVTFLFLILAVLYCVEASTALSRKVGYELKKPDAGLMVQSSLGILSRSFSFMFMPILGFLADQGSIFDDLKVVIYSYMIVPLSLSIVFLSRGRIEFFIRFLIYRLVEKGSYLKPSTTKAVKQKPTSLRFLFVLRKIRRLIFFSYIPYYLAWPTVIILIDYFPDNRAFMIGMASIFNGINTIILTFFIDPRLLRISRCTRLINETYNELVFVRFLSSLISFGVLILTYLFLEG